MLTTVLLAAWYAESDSSGGIIDFPERVLPTLTVWAVLAVTTEFMDRAEEPQSN